MFLLRFYICMLFLHSERSTAVVQPKPPFQPRTNEQLELEALNNVDSSDRKMGLLDIKLQNRLSSQITFLLERIEHVESTVNNLRRIVMVSWQRGHEGFLYNVFNTERNWEDAKEICQFFGGTLALIDSATKNNIVKSERCFDINYFSVLNLIIQNSGQDSADTFWIGIKTKTEMSNNTTSGYSNFSDDLSIGSCTIIDHNGRWKLRSCSQKNKFICQLNEDW